MLTFAQTVLIVTTSSRFRWLQCQLDLLNRLPTRKAIKEALGRLPRTLFETYDRMLEYIEEYSVELACKAFQLIVYPQRPLTTEELLEALAVNDNDARLDLNSTFSDARDLLMMLSSLVYEGELASTPQELQNASAHKSYRGIRLCHYTVEVPHTTPYIAFLLIITP